ncbi:protein YjiS [Escherichia coli]|uniref:Protein YjiS n=1 Tax=Escherichia coli TaxID=562 RepID=A0A376L389_ECOLX|nr:protein YjiS [Escherichia coli]
MEFHENKAKTPFIRLVQLWHAVRALAAANADPTSVTADE